MAKPIPVKRKWFYLSIWMIKDGRVPKHYFKLPCSGVSASWIGIVYKEGIDGNWVHIHKLLCHQVDGTVVPKDVVMTMDGKETDVTAVNLTAQYAGLMAATLRSSVRYCPLQCVGRDLLPRLLALEQEGLCICNNCFEFSDEDMVPAFSSN